MAIVVLTPPFLPSLVQSARMLRLLRLLRFLRLAPLVRVLFSAEGLRYAAVLTVLTALTGGAAFASVENISVGDGLYWALTTMTTVGYGDVTPKTAEGKAIAIAVMLIGIGFATLLIGAIAERFIRPSSDGVEDAEDDVLAHVRDISARTAAARAGNTATQASRLANFVERPRAEVRPRKSRRAPSRPTGRQILVWRWMLRLAGPQVGSLFDLRSPVDVPELPADLAASRDHREERADRGFGWHADVVEAVVQTRRSPRPPSLVPFWNPRADRDRAGAGLRGSFGD